jgi:tetratricopeptide (TPR) repeat protein
MEIPELLAAGQLATEAGEHLEAASAFSAACRLADWPWPLVQLAGNAWQLVGHRIKGRAFWLEAYRESVSRSPSERFELGSNLLACGAPVEAIACFDTVVREHGEDPSALNALAAAKRSAGDLPGASAAIERALRIDRTSGTHLLTAAQIRHCEGRLEDASGLLIQALSARPTHAPTRLQLGLTDLLAGRFPEGWAGFEMRPLPATPPRTQDWAGGSLSGSIVVLAEQGMGDLFHFIRFVPLLRERGAEQVIIECPDAAMRLLVANSFDVVRKGQAPNSDWSVPLLSLPHRLGVGGDTLMGQVPYLAARADAPAPRLGDPLRLGIVWQGSPEFGATFLRDFDVGLLSTLLDVPDVLWTSLQFGEAVPGAHDGIDKIVLRGDWLDTARQIRGLDGVISVDTSVAHLAGAMGTPVAILLPFSPDWRWGLTTDRTDWYPSAHLIRQRAPRDWAGTIPAVHDWIARLRSAVRARP